MSPRVLLGGAFVVSLVATAWSLSLSGIGPLGWRGAGLFPCELCWYQRILMYPLPVILAIALWRNDATVAVYLMPLAILGALVAGFHVLLQAGAVAEPGQCFVGSCTSVERTYFGLTIPKLSLVAFALVSGLVGAARLRNTSPYEG